MVLDICFTSEITDAFSREMTEKERLAMLGGNELIAQAATEMGGVVSGGEVLGSDASAVPATDSQFACSRVMACVVDFLAWRHGTVCHYVGKNMRIDMLLAKPERDAVSLISDWAVVDQSAFSRASRPGSELQAELVIAPDPLDLSRIAPSEPAPVAACHAKVMAQAVCPAAE